MCVVVNMEAISGCSRVQKREMQSVISGGGVQLAAV